jgi:O-antigen ligase
LELTLSRMSWVGAAGGIVVAILMLPSGPRRTLLPVVLLAVAIPVALGAFSGSSNTLQRLSSITHPLNETGTGQGDVLRVEIWQRAVSVAEQHPVAGVGLGRFQRMLGADFPPAGTQAHAHSTYLQLAVEGGALAVLGLLAVLVALKRDLVGVLRTDRLWGAVLLGACVAMLVVWLTDVTIRYSGMAVCFGLLFGMVAGRARSARAQAEAT